MNGFSIVNVRDRSTPWSRSETQPAVGLARRRRPVAASAPPASSRTSPGRRRAVAEGVAGDGPAVDRSARRSPRRRSTGVARRRRRRGRSAGAVAVEPTGDRPAGSPRSSATLARDPAGRVEEGVLVPRALEVAGQGVVVLGRDRVELVVVAAGAGDGQAEERLARGRRSGCRSGAPPPRGGRPASASPRRGRRSPVPRIDSLKPVGRVPARAGRAGRRRRARRRTGRRAGRR